MSYETLIRCCAPTLACLKTGSMFVCPYESREQMARDLRLLNGMFRDKGLHILPLRWRGGKALLYMYRPKRLEKDLQDTLSGRLLSECGYVPGSAAGCLQQLIARLRREEGFPHEVGLFLGYPPGDVEGFMHRKDECVLCGLWKVYGDVEGALRQFERCRRCTRLYLQRYVGGCALQDLAVAG